MENILFFSPLTLYQAFFYFFVYAFLGWIMEVISATVKTGKFVNRGFLNGPVCPIYGFGMITVLTVLNPFIDNILVLFLLGGLLATFLELVTGFVLEMIFHKRWWDYSQEPLNIGGYVCLKFSLLWGLGIVFVVRIIHQPMIVALQAITPIVLGKILVYIALVVIATDLTLTVLQILKLNRNYKEIDHLSDDMRKGSDLIGNGVSDATTKALQTRDYILLKISKSRLAKAFPSLHLKALAPHPAKTKKLKKKSK